MRSNTKLAELALDLLQQLYAESEPPLDFKKFKDEVERTGDCPKDWFLKHKISEERYMQIVSKFRSRRKVTDHEWRSMSMVMLDWAPTNVEAKR